MVRRKLLTLGLAIFGRGPAAVTVPKLPERAAYRVVAALPRPSRCTINSAMSAGVIPLIRLA